MHRILQSPLFVPLTFVPFDDADVGTVSIDGVLVFVSNEWSWSLQRTVSGELTEERRSCRKEEGEEQSGRRDWRTRNWSKVEVTTSKNRLSYCRWKRLLEGYTRVLSRCTIFATARRIKKPRYVGGIGTGSWNAAKYVSRKDRVFLEL